MTLITRKETGDDYSGITKVLNITPGSDLNPPANGISRCPLKLLTSGAS